MERLARPVAAPPHPKALLPALARFGPRGWAVALAAGLGAALLTGIPTVLIDNPVFGREIPPRPADYVIWIISSILTGLIAGTYAGSSPEGAERRTLAGGLLTYLAVGCPVCNKLVVLLLGTSGALSFFQPVQLYIGVAALLLLGWALLLRARAVTADACPISDRPLVENAMVEENPLMP